MSKITDSWSTSDTRIAYVDVSLTLWQRIRVYLRNVKDAILQMPPDSYSKQVRLKPGDAGYEEAPFVETVHHMQIEDPELMEKLRDWFPKDESQKTP